jgi:hypothetical protein
MTYRKVNRKRVNRRVKSVRSKGSKKLRGGVSLNTTGIGVITE